MLPSNPAIAPQRFSPLIFSACSLTFLLQPAVAVGTEPPGLAIYRKQCAECHGENGQGVPGKHDEPLLGRRATDALARKIEKTMPKDNEGTCVGDDAKQVAAYIYDAFYSPAAQARLRPPAKDLARLTIPQYRNSVMDLIGRFNQGGGNEHPISEEHGVKGFYRGFELPKPGDPKPEGKKSDKQKKRPSSKFERLDGNIAFHFGADSPDKDKMISEEFNIRWEGAVLAPETGMYEFLVKTENGARLYVNDDKKALIDAWVSSGPDVREEKKNIFLVGGRAYRLVLEHFKFKEKSASIELWWKPPHGVREIIPAEMLHNDRPQRRMIVDTTFPADDRSVGYERGTTISRSWDQAVTEAAVATAEHVGNHLDELAGTSAGAADREEKLRNFARTLVETAFRRPLDDAQKERYVETHFKSARSPDQAVKRVVLFTLNSPHFLYPDLSEKDRADDFDVASRLALALWDSIPDRKLLLAAASGKLHTRDQVEAEALRMIGDARTKDKLHGFFHHWLDFERAENTSKDLKAFPGFNEEVLADLRTSLLRFIDEVVWSGKSDYRELLQADYLLLNDRLGKFYGKPVQGGDFQRVTFDPNQRAGVVTHPYLLASLAYSAQSSPIQRGVFLTRNIVGMSLKPPPMAVAFDESHFNPKLTMREKVTELTRNNSCMSCHSVINPLGFSLENFDAIGRWRTRDNNQPVNPVSEFANEEGKVVRLTGPRDIVNYVADNPAGQRAFIRHLFNHMVKQQIPAYGHQIADQLQQSFAASGCNIQKLLLEISLIASLDGLPAGPDNVARE